MVEAIAELEPPVLSPFAPWLPVQAGFEPGFHLIALWDVAHKTGPYPNARQQISDEMKAHYWGTVIDSRTSMKFGVGEAYRRAGTIAPKGRAMTPKAGWTAKPSFIRVPRKER